MATITEAAYPKLWAAFEEVYRDGGGNELPEPVNVPASIVDLAGCEAALATLSEEDFELFCYGELEEQEEIEKRDFFLAFASKLLNDYF